MEKIHKFLVCEPKYFYTEHGEINYSINKWMKTGTPVDHGYAVQQWKLLRNVLRALDGEIYYMDPQPKLSDFVFAANYGLMHDDTVLISRFRHTERRPEEYWIQQWFLKYNYSDVLRINYMPKSCCFEGQGDALFLGEKIFAGYGFRTDRAAHEIIAETFMRETVSLCLIDGRFYHLDTCFCPLNDHAALYYPGAFDEESNRAIHENVPDLIVVSEAEAVKFLCNSVVVDNVVVMGAHPSDYLRRALHDRHFTVIVTPFDEFFKAGGSVRCVILNLN